MVENECKNSQSHVNFRLEMRLPETPHRREENKERNDKTLKVLALK
jgi:hypothetical protein